MQSCHSCQETNCAPEKAPVHRWEYPALPWQRLHVDFAGRIDSRMYTVIADAHTKWPEIIAMGNTTVEESQTAADGHV